VAGRWRITLSGGLGEVLKSNMRGPVSSAASGVAGNVNLGSVTDARVVVDDYTTDRAASSVTIAHPAGLRLQAKYGSLTRAAASAGLEVRGG
jgi:hypothetical protein